MYKVVIGARCLLRVPVVTVTDCYGDEGLYGYSVWRRGPEIPRFCQLWSRQEDWLTANGGV